MKHFIIKVDYLVPLNKIDELLDEHRKFLQVGYDKGILLFSGPMNPRTGGIVAARGESVNNVKNFFKNDPFVINNMAEYSYTEFNPVKFQDILKTWIV